MKFFLFLELLVCVLSLSACLQNDAETAEWWCGYYNSCAHEENTMCGFYGNCPGKGSVWGTAGSDANSSHVGGIEHPAEVHH